MCACLVSLHLTALCVILKCVITIAPSSVWTAGGVKVCWWQMPGKRAERGSGNNRSPLRQDALGYGGQDPRLLV